MTFRASAFFGAIFGTISAAAGAYEPDRAINNFSHEYVVCAVYYTISEEGMRRLNRSESANTSQSAAERALSIALLFSDAATVAARQQLESKSQLALMKGDFANFSMLIAEYGELCKSAVEDPRARLMYWLSKVD